MNWNSQEFIWLWLGHYRSWDYSRRWAVARSIQKHKRAQQGADSEDFLFGKGEPWYIIGAAILQPISVPNTWLVLPVQARKQVGYGTGKGWMIPSLAGLFMPFYQLMNNKLGKIITMPDFLAATQRVPVCGYQLLHW